MKTVTDRTKARQTPMKILFLTDSFLPHAGGSRVYYYNLYSRLVQLHPDQVTVLTKKVPGWRQFDNSISHDRFRIIRHFRPLPTLQIAQLPKIVFPLAEAFFQVLRGGMNLVHTGDLYPPGVVALCLKRAFGIPFVAYCHGEDFTLLDSRRYQPRVRNHIYREAHTIVAACEFARQKLLGIGIPEKRICKITPGVDCQRFSPRPANQNLVRQYRLENRRVLLTVSRLISRKGHALVLRALARILPHCPDATYLIVGKGPERSQLEQLAAELGISHAVRFAGYVPEEDLADFYNLCDVFVMMNHEEDNGDIEGFGMVFLEASAAGKAVIGGRSGGTGDSIEHGVTGFLIRPDEVEELAATVRLVLENDEVRKRLGAAGMRRARAAFSWESRAEQLHQVNRMVFGNPDANPRAEPYGLRSSSLGTPG
jgi:phosphatidyl-myo-inositol dimannoside synthase